MQKWRLTLWFMVIITTGKVHFTGNVVILIYHLNNQFLLQAAFQLCWTLKFFCHSYSFNFCSIEFPSHQTFYTNFHDAPPHPCYFNFQTHLSNFATFYPVFLCNSQKMRCAVLPTNTESSNEQISCSGLYINLI